MKKSTKLITMLIAAVLLTAICLMQVSSLALYPGNRLGSGTVTSASNRTLASGVTYTNAVYRDAGSRNQQVHALEFNPKQSNYMPLVYSKYSGYGDITLNSAADAESKYGYNVLGGINASFFSFVGTCCNTYGGVNISDGKVIQGSQGNGATYMLVFDSSGSSDIVYSRVSYSLSVNGSAWQNALQNINMYPYTLGTGIYYYDTSCGTSTDTNAAGVEVVFNKTDGTEITVGGTLTGTVAQIRNVSSGGAIGRNQFVLYASNQSSWAAGLRALKVGDKAQINVAETLAGAKTKMENASSALVTYGYHIVSGGVNVTSSNGLGEDFNRARAQRTAVGVKSDGTLVMIAANGRTSSYTGLTVYELADMLIGLGCVTAVNLDGGGSTQMTVENTSGGLSAVMASSRRVANSLLIVQRPTISNSDRNTLSGLIDSAGRYLEGYTVSNTAQLQSDYNYAKSIYDSSKSMPGDYTKAIMRLRQTMAATVITGYNPGIYFFASGTALRSSASDSAPSVASIPAGTTLSITQVSGLYGYTGYADKTGWVKLTGNSWTEVLKVRATGISAVEERPADADLTVSWASVPGASGYTYKIIELAGEPDPGNSDESLNARELAFVQNGRATSVTIPAGAMTNGKYIKIAVAAVFPQGSSWSVKYVTGSEVPFTDVNMNSWYYEPVRYVYSQGLFSGTAPTLFSPGLEMTRGMMALVLYRYAGEPAVSGTMPFEDVPDGAYYYNAVLWASQNGIVSGHSPTVFAPNSSVNREQAACFIYRYAALAGLDTSITPGFSLSSYTDYDQISSFALTAMTWAVDKNIINGDGSGALLPKANATRAQIATIFMNFGIFDGSY